MTHYTFTEMDSKYKDTNRLQVKGWKIIYHANTELKESWNGCINI